MDEPTRADLNLARQALRNDWPLPPGIRKMLLQQALDICDPEHEEYEDTPEGPKKKPPPPRRTVLAALKVIAMFARLSLAQQALDLAREKYQGKKSEVPLEDIVKAAEERYRERLNERGDRE